MLRKIKRPWSTENRKFFSYMVSSSQFSWLKELGIAELNNGVFDGNTWSASGAEVDALCPSTNKSIARVRLGTVEECHKCISASKKAWKQWANIPAPQRGDIVRQIGDSFRQKRNLLGKLLALEVGKIVTEGRGEIQEIVDICDFGMGLSRTFAGKVIPSERHDHLLLEQWNPLGVVGVISAFNFPAAVFGWNMSLAMVCGNVLVWKGAPTTNLTTIAVTKIISDVLRANNVPGAVVTALCGGTDVGAALTADKRVAMVSFTGSCQAGAKVQEVVTKRFGKCLLELGGNNAIIVNKDADLGMVTRSVVFAAAGTAGQRCTTTRRLFIHEAVYEKVLSELVKAYKALRIGDALDENVLIGPLHTKAVVEMYKACIAKCKANGGKIEYGGEVIKSEGNFVQPTIITGDCTDSSTWIPQRNSRQRF